MRTRNSSRTVGSGSRNQDKPSSDLDARTAPSKLPDLGERYGIEREIGRGGMGRVFAGRDRKLGREVALKVLAPGAHSEEELRRFEQEARAAGSLNHPNILAGFGIATHRGPPYI